MTISTNTGLAPLEGRRFILGREGHIYIADPAASKEHAELKIVDGKILMRDLNSTNGIYVMENDKPVRFDETYLSPDQIIEIGMEQHTVRSLLSIIGVFAE